MLIQRQITNRILVDAQRLRKESLELRHTCRNTRSISKIVEGPTTGGKKVAPITGAWRPLRSKESAEGHGVGLCKIG